MEHLCFRSYKKEYSQLKYSCFFLVFSCFFKLILFSTIGAITIISHVQSRFRSLE